MKRLSVRTSVILCAISLAVIVCLIIATIITGLNAQAISDWFNQPMSRAVNVGEPIYTSSFSSSAKRRLHDEAVCRDIEAEGIVLLENGQVSDGEGGTRPSLPLEKESSVTVFGQGASDFLYAPTAYDNTAVSSPVTFYRALEESGFAVNPDMRAFYDSGAGSRYRRSMPHAVTSPSADSLVVGEVPISEYSSAPAQSFEVYGDAAIVVIGRAAADGYDLPRAKEDGEKYYLEPTDNELNMLAYVRSRFDNVVLVINSVTPLMIGDITKNELYAPDSVLWVGTPGATGARAIGYVLNGYMSPSGRLTETWTADHSSSPSQADAGAHAYAWKGNAPAANSSYYTVLSDGVYVGYRYYETRYEDKALNAGNAGDYSYSEEVLYPFGYGLSYTRFKYSQFESEYNAETDCYDVSVVVANTGTAAAKETVQVYMQAPYTTPDVEAGIERPSVELVGSYKTGTLYPEGSESGPSSQAVTVSVPASSFEVYDKTAAGGTGGYVTEGGTYYLTVASDAHSAVNNILKYKQEHSVAVVDEQSVTADYAKADGGMVEAHVAEASASVYDESAESDGEEQAGTGEVVNRFAAADISTYDEEYVKLSRSDWTGTMPETYYDGAAISTYETATAMRPDTSHLTSGEAEREQTTDSGLAAFELIGADYNDERFDSLVDMLSRQTKADFVRMGGNTINVLVEVSMPETKCRDGVIGVNTQGDSYTPEIAYPAPVVVASTWNVTLAENLGKCLSEDALATGVSGIFAPSLDIRRDPFSGTNRDAYSEDPYLTGVIGLAQTTGMRDKKCFAFIGEYALAVQEDYSVGLSVYADEQTIRSIYLRPFEMVIKGGGATAVIQSASRIGPEWVGASEELMTDVLRGEWGFEGMTLTARGGNDSYMDTASGLCAGTDMWFNGNSLFYQIPSAALATKDVSEALDRAVKNVMYSVISSNAMNGITAETRFERIIPPWQVLFIVLDVVLGVAALSLPVIVIINRAVTRKKSDRTVSVDQ